MTTASGRATLTPDSDFMSFDDFFTPEATFVSVLLTGDLEGDGVLGFTISSSEIVLSLFVVGREQVGRSGAEMLETALRQVKR